MDTNTPEGIFVGSDRVSNKAPIDLMSKACAKTISARQLEEELVTVRDSIVETGFQRLEDEEFQQA